MDGAVIKSEASGKCYICNFLKASKKEKFTKGPGTQQAIL